MQKKRFSRADGRYGIFYGFGQPLPEILATAHESRGDAQLELRWNAMLGEQVIVSTVRQGRTFLPPADACPLCPTTLTPGPASRGPRTGEGSAPAVFVTEIPALTYEIAVFENRFPSFRLDATDVADESALLRRSRAGGVCEVVLYAPDHEATLASLPEEQVRNLVDVWCDRYGELALLHGIAYVFVFENRGKEIGVTLTHPHGQIYAFPYVPPRVQQEQAAAFVHFTKTARCLQCDIVAEEIADGRRVVATEQGFLAYVPFAARLPYEVHIAATAHRESLLDLFPGERNGLARILRRVQAAYDGLWGFPMPYTMSMHQRASDGVQRAGDHLHIEFMPPYRTKDKLKYLAGVETGAGTFINDTSPEEKAAELRSVVERSAAS